MSLYNTFRSWILNDSDSIQLEMPGADRRFRIELAKGGSLRHVMPEGKAFACPRSMYDDVCKATLAGVDRLCVLPQKSGVVVELEGPQLEERSFLAASKIVKGRSVDMFVVCDGLYVLGLEGVKLVAEGNSAGACLDLSDPDQEPTAILRLTAKSMQTWRAFVPLFETKPAELGDDVEGVD